MMALLADDTENIGLVAALACGRSPSRHQHRWRTDLRRRDAHRLAVIETLAAAGLVCRRRTVRRTVRGGVAELVELEHTGARQTHHGLRSVLQRLLGCRSCILRRLILLEVVEPVLRAFHLRVEIAKTLIPPEPELMQEARLERRRRLGRKR